jgi:hypothetical protein
MKLEIPNQITMKEYRELFRKRQGEYLRKFTKEDFKDAKILDIIIAPQSINMREIGGTDEDVAAAIERFYENDGR